MNDQYLTFLAYLAVKCLLSVYILFASTVVIDAVISAYKEGIEKCVMAIITSKKMLSSYVLQPWYLYYSVDIYLLNFGF